MKGNVETLSEIVPKVFIIIFWYEVFSQSGLITAEKFSKITFQEVFEKGLKVMDMTAFTLCHENKLPIIVFDMNKPGNLNKIVLGEEEVGTLIY